MKYSEMCLQYQAFLIEALHILHCVVIYTCMYIWDVTTWTNTCRFTMPSLFCCPLWQWQWW